MNYFNKTSKSSISYLHGKLCNFHVKKIVAYIVSNLCKNKFIYVHIYTSMHVGCVCEIIPSVGVCHRSGIGVGPTLSALDILIIFEFFITYCVFVGGIFIFN